MNSKELLKSINLFLEIRYFRYPLLIIFQLLAVLSFGQSVKPDNIQALARLDSLELKANNYSQHHPVEKVYIHFDKPYYVLGEDSWYKAYVVRGSDLNPTDISSVLYVDWVDPSGKIKKHHRLKVENGGAVGNFTIDESFPEGTYTVRAYTNWMRNEASELFYSKRIQVFNGLKKNSPLRSDSIQSKIDLQFFPEGGTLIAGIYTQMAFKAIDATGRGIEVKGEIVDEQNNPVTPFKSAHNGMGLFPFTANGHKTYKAILPSGETYPLPIPSNKGITLAASNMNSSKIVVRVRPGKDYQFSGAYLIGHSRGSICYAAYIKADSPLKDISILKEKLPEGILQFTLFDAGGIPQCERMVFIKKDNKIIGTVSSNKEQYAPRDSIILNFRISDQNGSPIENSLSVSVSDADFITAEKNSENIYTRLLLQSDLTGNVEHPGWYFESQAPDRTYALDLVMLTHGWSRYNWKKILDTRRDSIAFMPEKGITLKGQILDKDEPIVSTPFTLSAKQGENEFFNIYESDSLGRFSIPDLDFSDSVTFSWRVMGGRKGKVQHSEINLDTAQDIPPITEPGTQYQVAEGTKNELFENLLARFLKTGVWNTSNTQMLDEVVVTGERIIVKSAGPNAILVKPDELDIKSRISTAQLVSRYSLASKIWSISIDGHVQEGSPYSILSGIPIEQIEYLIVGGNIHDGYGIAIGTKTTTSHEEIESVKQIAKGYDTVREFYHPRYGPLDISTTSPDNRITLYWNGNLKTKKDGTATVKFYNTDTTQKLRIVVEGIAAGIPFSTVEIIGKPE